MLHNHGDVPRWMCNNWALCLSKVVEWPLTMVVKIACFITNFIKLLGIFISDNNCINPNIRSFSTSVSFETTLGFGSIFMMMGSDKTFCKITFFVRIIENELKVFLITSRITFIALLISWSRTEGSTIFCAFIRTAFSHRDVFGASFFWGCTCCCRFATFTFSMAPPWITHKHLFFSLV